MENETKKLTNIQRRLLDTFADLYFHNCLARCKLTVSSAGAVLIFECLDPFKIDPQPTNATVEDFLALKTAGYINVKRKPGGIHDIDFTSEMGKYNQDRGLCHPLSPLKAEQINFCFE